MDTSEDFYRIKGLKLNYVNAVTPEEMTKKIRPAPTRYGLRQTSVRV